ncbi:MAG: TlpA disulfide reductase family protein [Chitinophagaceae bacterium]
MKTFLFSIIAVIIGLTAEAKDSFRISGNVNGLHSGTVTLSYIHRNQTKQLSEEMKNGKFVLTGNLPEPERLILNFTAGDFNREISFFAGNENITVTVDTAHWETPVITGSPTQKDFEIYHQLTKTVDEKSEALNKTGAGLYRLGKLTEQLKDSLFSTHDKLDQEKKYVIAGFVKEHPASAVSAWAISTFYGFDPNLEEVLDVFNSLSEKNQTSLYGRQITEIIDAAKRTAIGKTAEDFTVSDMNGKPVSLSSYRGKYVLVDFWASWCGPCRAENPNVVNTYNKYHSAQFDVLGVSLDTNKDAWLKAVNNDKLEWKQVSDLKAWDSKIVAIYGLKGIPFNMLLDKEGKIIAKNLRGAAFESKLKEVLN